MVAPFKNCLFNEYPRGSITQYFGENPKMYVRFGLAGHNGIDLVAPHGTPLLAVEDGIVVSTKEDPGGFGRNVRFISGTSGVCNVWTYGHCDSILVKPGDVITAGQQIATMGNTGFVVTSHDANRWWGGSPSGTDGTHLHLGLRKVRIDPKGWSYPGSTIKMVVLKSENGFKGCIDPLPEFSNLRPKPVTQVESLKETVSILQRVLNLYKQLKNKQ